jgi:hypothetical protein
MMARTGRRQAVRKKKKAAVRARVGRALGLTEAGASRSGGSRRSGQSLVGLDVGHSPAPLSARRLVPLLALGLLVALAVASLRIEMIRLRYALAEASLEEKRLVTAQRSLIAQRLSLRDPVRLAERAGALGFVRPDRLIVLSDRGPLATQDEDTILAATHAPAAATLDRP